MAILTEAEFRKRIRTPHGGGYFFFGEEDYLKAHALRLAREAICPDPSLALFNDIRLDAMDFDAGKLLSALTPPPMMNEYKIVTVEGLDLRSPRAADLADLAEALATLPETDYNLLILSIPDTFFDPGRLPKSPSTLFKTLEKHLTPVQFDAVTPARLAAWVGRHFEHSSLSATPDVCAFVVGYCKKDMFTLAAEIDKICAYVHYHKRDRVTREDVEAVAARDFTEGSDDFAMMDAMLAGDYNKALTILDFYQSHRIESTIVMGEISRIYSELMAVKLLCDTCSAAEIAKRLRLHEYRVGLYLKRARAVSADRLKEILALCAQADASLKNSSLDYIAIERLICAL